MTDRNDVLLSVTDEHNHPANSDVLALKVFKEKNERSNLIRNNVHDKKVSDSTMIFKAVFC